MTMMLKAHFDGKALAPDVPVDLPRDCAQQVQVTVAEESRPPLLRLLDAVGPLPEPEHYLDGCPKKS